jgi:hypothetical protein
VPADIDGDLAAKQAERIVLEGDTAIGVACDVDTMPGDASSLAEPAMTRAGKTTPGQLSRRCARVCDPRLAGKRFPHDQTKGSQGCKV